MIAQESIERIKTEASILEVVGETVQLRRAGQYYTGLCPFHSEKSPSFFVKDSSNGYICYGCGASGNVISFVMATRAMTFPDAVEYLAGRFRIELKRDKGFSKSPSVDRERLFAISRAAHIFFQRSLVQVKGGEGEYKFVREYLHKRGLNAAAINTFGIGYAPTHRGALIEVLKQGGFDNENILLTGLVRRTASGELYELFRGRLVFPIFVDAKRIAGFGGRIIPGVFDRAQEEQSPKYLNSPESPIYQKSKTVYGLPQAFETIRTAKELYVVEGYMDVVGLFGADVRNVVACCGTAITEQHIKRFASVANRVHLLFDGDQAGRQAAVKAFMASRNAQVDIDVCFLPEGEDPDDFARAHAGSVPEALKALPKAELIDVYIDGLFSRYGCSPTDRPGANLLGRMCEEAAKAIGGIEREIVRQRLLARTALRLGVESSQLERLIPRGGGDTQHIPQNRTTPQGERNAALQPVRGASLGGAQTRLPSAAPEEDGLGSGALRPVSELPRLDQEVLMAVIPRREKLLSHIMNHQVLTDGLEAETVKFLFELQRILKETNGDTDRQKIAFKDLLAHFGPSWLKLWRRAYAQVEQGGDAERSYHECLRKYDLNKIEREIAEAQEEVRKHPDGGPEELQRHLLDLYRRKQILSPAGGTPQSGGRPAGG